MESSTKKLRGRCSGGCIPDTSGYRCAYCHFELSPNKCYAITNQKGSPSKFWQMPKLRININISRNFVFGWRKRK